MSFRTHADRKGWDVEEVQVNLKQNKVYVKSGEECESKEDPVHTFEKEVKLIGNSGNGQRSHLIEISDN